MNSSLSSLCKREIDLGPGKRGHIFSLPALEQRGAGLVSRLPISLRIVLESLLRNCDNGRVLEEHVLDLARWQPNGQRTTEIPFVVGRIVLNCAAGIPLLGDLTAMRSAMKRSAHSPGRVEPKVPVDMTLDHTLTVDYHGSRDALQRNMRLEIERNKERFSFVKWAMQAYRGIRLIPPGFGILHQLNLEFFAPGLLSKNGTYYPDTLVGTDSHTGMIAGLGTVGWGVGGIEAEAAVLGQPVYMLTPDVIGVNVVGELRAGVTATDMVLYVTEMLRGAKVVAKFVEFFGDGVAGLTIPDRATIANMAPEYGATIGFFPVDAQTCSYMRQTGRSEAQVAAMETYFRAQGCFGAPRLDEIDYTQVLTLDLASITPGVAGPKRPQDRVPLAELKAQFEAALQKPPAARGYGKAAPTRLRGRDAGNTNKAAASDGDVVIAAITSCTNTSNPGVMLAAGLVARKAVERGLKTKPWVKTSLTPGSVVVSKYLEATGLQRYLDQLGFAVAGYSCGTCVGASGPIDPKLEKSITENDIVACAVLSGNRNFEARIHPAVRAAFLASPPLVVAFALAGRVDIDLMSEPVGKSAAGELVYLKDIWPTQDELASVMSTAANPSHYRAVYEMDFESANPLWAAIPHSRGEIYSWDRASTYIKEPPFLLDPGLSESSLREFSDARAIAILGDSITTDHISPIGNIKATSPAGTYLQSLGVSPADFNNYGARRMNHEVMVRGAFANVRLRNLMVPGVEGGVTVHHPSGERMSIFDAAMRYAQERVPLFVIAGEEYGTGSARDWAAKGTRLLGVRAVIANSFERIHRSNLVGMGVLPCQLPAGTTAASLGLDGSEQFDLLGLDENAKPRQPVTLVIRRRNGTQDSVTLTLRIDTQAELDYVRRGGILPYILDGLMSQ
ncbi:MAG: aconitate hydratase 1 [Betaproteobacteria bacterium RIFCSPLOWO2_12_FULL_62_13]|nr:MAG: aconitate hydratase 1 [Betaproteobacteria bacterium RIFCSPLOWO2_12_FULL_62_13]